MLANRSSHTLQCDPTQCRQNKLYPGTAIKSKPSQGTGQRKRDLNDGLPSEASLISNGVTVTETHHEDHPLKRVKRFSLPSPKAPKSVKLLGIEQTPSHHQDGYTPGFCPSPEKESIHSSLILYFNANSSPKESTLLGSVKDPTSHLAGDMLDSSRGLERISEGSKLFPPINNMDISLELDPDTLGQFSLENYADFRKDWPSADELPSADNFDWVEDLMASDLPSLEYDWPWEKAGAAATHTDISSSPNTLLDFNYSVAGVEAPYAFQTDVYDPNDVGPPDSPLLKLLKPKLQHTPSPPLDGPESDDAKPVPSQGDAVLISFGGKVLEVAHTAAAELLVSDDEMSYGSEKGMEVCASMAKTGRPIRLDALAAGALGCVKLLADTCSADTCVKGDFENRLREIDCASMDRTPGFLQPADNRSEKRKMPAEEHRAAAHEKEYGHVSDAAFESADAGLCGRTAESSFEIPLSSATGHPRVKAPLTSSHARVVSDEDTFLPRSKSATFSQIPSESSGFSTRGNPRDLVEQASQIHNLHSMHLTKHMIKPHCHLPPTHQQISQQQWQIEQIPQPQPQQQQQRRRRRLLPLQTQMFEPAERTSDISRSVFTPIDDSRPLEPRNVEQEPLRNPLSKSTLPNMKKAVISIEDLTILLRDSNLILTTPMEQVYCPKDEPSLVDIILLDDDADSKISATMYPEALRYELGTCCSEARLIHCVCNIEIENCPREISSDRSSQNTMPLASQTSPAKYRIYDHVNTPSSRYSCLEYIRSISDQISQMPDPNGERLVTIIYSSMATGTVVKRATIAPLEPSELSPLPTSYSLRWLDPNWRTIESMISDLHSTNNLIPCRPVDLKIQQQEMIPCALLHPAFGPSKFISDIEKKLVIPRTATYTAKAAARPAYENVVGQSVEIDKAIAHARRRNRCRIIAVFEKPVDAVKDLASLL